MKHYFINKNINDSAIFALSVNLNGEITYAYGYKINGVIENVAIERFPDPYEINSIFRKLKFSRNGRYHDLEKCNPETFNKIFKKLLNILRKEISPSGQ